MEEIISPGIGVEFRFKLGNRGRGELGMVTLGGANLGGFTMNCEFQQTEGTKRSIVFNEEMREAVLICKSPLRDLSSYETTVALDFSYGYEIKEQNSLTLVK